MITKEAVREVAPALVLNWFDRLRASPLGYRLARGTFWSLAGALVSRGLGLAASIVAARLLGKNSFGELGMVQSTIAMFATFAGLGLGLTAAKHVAEYGVGDPARAGRIIGLSSLLAWCSGIVMTVGLLAFAPWLAERTLAAPQLVSVIRLSAPLLLIEAINGAQIGALNGFEAFQATARINLLSGLAAFPISIVGVWGWGLPGAVAALVIVAMLRVVLSAAAVRTEASRLRVPLGWRGCWRERVVLWRFSIPAMLAGLATAPAVWGANVLLVHGASGYSEMATFGAASQWRNVVLFLPGIVMQAVLPIFASSAADGRSGSFQRTLVLTQGMMVLLAFPLCTALMFSADWLMRLYWKTSAYESAALIGCVLAALVQCLGAATGPALQARSRMWLGLAFNVSWGLFYVGFVLLFVRSLGATALAFGQTIAYALLTLWGFIYMKADLPSGMLRRVVLGLVAALLLGGLCLALPMQWRVYLALPATLVAALTAGLVLIDDTVRGKLLEMAVMKRA